MGVPEEIKKQTYSEELDRLGYFCTICGKEVRNKHGLVYFTSEETVQAIYVCHDCLPDWFE